MRDAPLKATEAARSRRQLPRRHPLDDASYEGLISEDDVFRTKCENALISVEPFCRSYLPRLRERFLEERRAGRLGAYMLKIAISVIAKAKHELAPEGVVPDPITLSD
jgi:hypothetical protein